MQQRSRPSPTATLCNQPETTKGMKRNKEWRWSSVRAYFAGIDDALVKVRPVFGLVARSFAPCVANFLRGDQEE